jgi:uncharacterized membrane protein YkoI
MTPFTKSSLLAICTVAVVASAGAQQPTHPTPKSDIPAALAREAKISLDAARGTARARLPKASIQSEELERENGRLIYSFDMKTPVRAGIDEVNVNAVTGAIVGKVGHEGGTSEAKEAASEHKSPVKP